MNWAIIIIFGIGALALTAFLVVRNIKDEKKVENQMKNDYPKPPHDKEDIRTEDILK
jgi:hypothetical protein